MLHFVPCFAARDAGGGQGCFISASPSGVSGTWRPIKLCINKSTYYERVYKLDPALKKNQNPTPKNQTKNPTEKTLVKINTLIFGMAFVCQSHLDLFGEATGRSVTVGCEDFPIYPQVNFFDASLTTSVIQPA